MVSTWRRYWVEALYLLRGTPLEPIAASLIRHQYESLGRRLGARWIAKRPRKSPLPMSFQPGAYLIHRQASAAAMQAYQNAHLQAGLQNAANQQSLLNGLHNYQAGSLAGLGLGRIL